MRKISSLFYLAIFFFACNCCHYTDTQNKLSIQEKEQGWQSLFNGKVLEGWRQYNGEGIPKSWEICRGTLRSKPNRSWKSGEITRDNLIYVAEKFDNFELCIEWKTSKKGNSGIFFLVDEIPNTPIYDTGLEMQILDNQYAEDNKEPSHLAGSLYDLLPAKQFAINPGQEWNCAKIKIENGNATHYINNEVVLEYTLWTPEWDQILNQTCFISFEGEMKEITQKGYIGLENHGHEMWFRNIKIRKLQNTTYPTDTIE